MTEPRDRQLVFQAHADPINATLMEPEKPSNVLAVAYPGATSQFSPTLLRLTIQLLLKKGFSVLRIDKHYGEDPEFQKLSSQEEALALIKMDTTKVLSEISQLFPGMLHTLVSQSLGGYAVASALAHQTVKPKQVVWLTPSLMTHWATMKSPSFRSFAIIGDADPRFLNAQHHLPESSLIFEAADHALEVSGNPIRSAEILKEALLALDEWLVSS